MLASLGMTGTGMRVDVVGAGVSGLTCALRLLEAGLQVRLVSREAPASTTSAVAGAIWFPYRGLPNDRTGPWARRSYEVFDHLAAKDEIPVTPVNLLWLSAATLQTEPWWFRDIPQGGMTIADIGDLPPGYVDGRIVSIFCVQAPAYLEWLSGRFRQLGGEYESLSVKRLDELPGSLIVNCSGLGARALADDSAVRPIRGQVLYVRPRAPVRFMMDESYPGRFTYILVRPDVTILGGTLEENDTELRPRKGTATDILRRAKRLQPSLAGASLLGSAVGLRPFRPEVRVELDELPDGRRIIHNYGHAGHGFTLSWGCADEVLSLATGRDALSATSSV